MKKVLKALKTSCEMSDLSQLPASALTERGITAHIASRYHQGMPFSTISTKVLVALNTFTNELDINQEQVFKDMATRIYNRMTMRFEGQACVFLGENGSGKSEYAAALSRALLTLADNPLSTRCRSFQPVFDAFATAKTGSSLASSMAGLFREFQFDAECNFIGLSLYDYRLNSHRITNVSTNERNYHVFYYLLNGLSDAERRYLQLEDQDFKFLGHRSQLHIPGIDDRMKFKQLKLALSALGFSKCDLANIFQILAAILHLGQLQIRSVLTDISQSASVAVEIVNTDVLHIIAQFLGVMPEVLQSSIVAKTVKLQGERVTVMLDQRGAKERVDILARTLYTMLFSYIMDRINSAISMDPEDPRIALNILMADFPGFQPNQGQGNNRRHSNLDRLLHNCANEMLYNYLVHAFFRAPEEILESEDVSVPVTEYFDNAETVKTLAKPHTGVISVINDYARKDRDASSLSESLKRRFPNSLAVASKGSEFLVNHYAGETSYSMEGLLEDANESLSSDLIHLFHQSTYNDFLKSVFNSAAVADATVDNVIVEAHVASEPRRQVSVRRNPSELNNENPFETGKKFGSVRRTGSVRYESKPVRRVSNPLLRRGRNDTSGKNDEPRGILNYIQSLDQAIDAMENNHSYFVLCMKPNDNHLVSSLDARCVRQQASALSIPELAQRTSVMDLSIFMPFNEFLRHSTEALNLIDTGETERDAVTRVVADEGWSARDAVIGITGVFLSENSWIQLVDPKLHFVEEAAAKFAKERDDGQDVFSGNDFDTHTLAGNFGNMFSYMTNRQNKFEAVNSSAEMPPGAVDETAPPDVSRQRKTWLAIVRAYTFWLPTAFIRGTFASVKLAWREKLAINMIIWGICAGSIILLIGMPYFICPLQNIMSEGQLAEYSYDSNPDQVYASIRGTVYDITDFGASHYPSVVSRDDVLDYGGKDISDIFPVPVSAVCSLVKNDKVVIGDPKNYTDDTAQYHDFRAINDDDYRPDWYLQHMAYFNSHYLKSFLGYTPESIENMIKKKSKTLFSLDGYVYDVTDYVDGNIFDMSNNGSTNSADTNFLDNSVVSLIQENVGQDLTSKFKDLNLSPSDSFEVHRCLRNLFMMGKLDTQNSTKCLFARYFLLSVTAFVVLLIVIKFLAALQFGGYEYPDDLDKFIICQVPVYTEDENSLHRALDSLTRTKYDDKRKLLVIICDGMIVGAGNEKPTPRIVLDILGHPEDVHPPALSMESLGNGEEQHNYGKVYTGLYESGGHIVPYMVVVKVGKPTEVFRPGNRGKRDSQILLMRFLNRVHYNSPMSPLELEMYHQIQNVIGISPSYYSLLMQVDADTVVAPESLSQMTGAMVRNIKIQAICGESELSNSRESLITMIQVYEYYISHNLAKAFESLFGSVTCLPGCFSLYRLYEEDNGKPLLISHPILEKYSECSVRTLHMKNLLQLGEDRYLTTLLLKYNPQFSTKFLRHAHAYTVAPDSWSVFLSQRRRWINSTVHNMVELVPMSQMCGFCLFSMRFMVLVDLFSTFVQPVTLGYIAYLIYLCVTRGDSIPWTSIFLIIAIYGLQAIIFMVRMKWEMIGWMIVYILALPIHSFLLPLYSFWYMDDFSWGNTRMVVGEKGKTVVVNDEGHFDPSVIPLKTWKEHEDEEWDHDIDAQLTEQREYDAASIAPTAAFVEASRDPFKDSVGSEYRLSSLPPTSENLIGPTDQEVTDALRGILAASDLTKVTKRNIREQLRDQFGISFENRKEYISWAIEAILAGEV